MEHNAGKHSLDETELEDGSNFDRPGKRAKNDETGHGTRESNAALKREEVVSGDSTLSVHQHGLTALPPDYIHEILRSLNLKEGFRMRGTCRHFRFKVAETDDGNAPPSDKYDVLRYCYIKNYIEEDLAEETDGDINMAIVFAAESRILARVCCESAAAVRALIANETCLKQQIDRVFWRCPLDFVLEEIIQCDSAQDLSVLLQSGYIRPDNMIATGLIEAIAQGHWECVTILEAFLQEESAKAPGTIPLCSTCGNNVAVIQCDRRGKGCTNDSANVRYCRSCVMATPSFCRLCFSYTCPDCRPCNQCVKFKRCHICHKMVPLPKIPDSGRTCEACEIVECKKCQTGSEWQTKEVHGKAKLLCGFCVKDYEWE